MLRQIENDERCPSEQIADLMTNCLGVPLTLSQIEAIQTQAGGKIIKEVMEDLLQSQRIFSIGLYNLSMNISLHCSDLPRCENCISALPTRSAIVGDNFSVGWVIDLNLGTGNHKI